MATAREELTVHKLNPVHGRGPAFYASLTDELLAKAPKRPLPPCGGGLGWGGSCHVSVKTQNLASLPHSPYRQICKVFLVSTLWDHLAATESPHWKGRRSSDGTPLPIRLTHGPLGRPRLLLGGNRGPAISFSEGGGRVWAAISGDDSDIGIDVAGPDEFRGEYPFDRVFLPEELEHALILADGDPGRASALLWSVKEAVVKAMGCAFHLVDQRQITVYPAADGAAEGIGGYAFRVGLTGKALARFPMTAERTLWVRSFPESEMWLSVALLDRSSADHE